MGQGAVLGGGGGDIQLMLRVYNGMAGLARHFSSTVEKKLSKSSLKYIISIAKQRCVYMVYLKQRDSHHNMSYSVIDSHHIMSYSVIDSYQYREGKM